ncbi:hypothetical protein CN925_12055 [Bacillus sp. AFS055030]|nr:hypothetical protein CN925_12055 [Bacillus sp. AFS055030]
MKFIRLIDYSIVFKIILFHKENDWNERVPGSYGRCGKAETPQAHVEEAKESRPMESEQPVVEITETQLTYQNLIDNFFSTA